MLEFDWHPTDECNFDCSYCHPNIALKKNRLLQHDLEGVKIAERFLSLNQNFHVSISGGEPFMLPNFVEFCKLITGQGNEFSVNTNLTFRTLLQDLVEKVNPKKVRVINAAEHICERERLGLSIDDFVEDIKLLQDRNFLVNVFYVLFPELFYRFRSDVDYLIERGVYDVSLKLFKGTYNGKRYPESYTSEQRKQIRLFEKNAYKFTEDYLSNKLKSVYGVKCRAGYTSFKIEVNGDVKRCAFNGTKYGNLYKGTFKPGEQAIECLRKQGFSANWCLNNIVRE